MADKTTSQYRVYDSVYDRQFQAEIVDRIRAIGEEGGDDTWADIIADVETRHSWRRTVMNGLWKRSIGQPASAFEWGDPLEADGVPIKARTAIGATKVNHRLHTTFDRTIVTNKSSYFLGTAPVVETEDAVAEATIQDVFGRNDFESLILEKAQSATRSGSGYTIFSNPKGVNDLILSDLPDWQAVVFYDQVTGEPVYGFLWFPKFEKGKEMGTEYRVYDEKTVTTFTKRNGDVRMRQSDTVPHGVGAMPIIEWANNTERLGDVELTLTLQDAYDILDSDMSSEVTQLRLAYLFIVGLTGIDDEWVNALQETGVLALDSPLAGGATPDARFITKNMQSDKIMEIMENLEERIFRYSNSFNPDSIGSSGDITAFEIEQRLFKLEQSSKETELSFKRSLSRMVEIVANFNGTMQRPSFDANEVKFVFQRNVPQNMIENLKGLKEAGFVLSQKLIAANAPFNIDQELNQQQLDEEAFDMGGAVIDTGEPGEVAQPVEADKDLVLNGAQIKSALDIAERVKTGIIEREQGINMLEIMFNIDRSQAVRML